ncbi:MAG: hypothetical protein V3V96_16465 [Acidiferrobacterales bacterium]
MPKWTFNIFREYRDDIGVKRIDVEALLWGSRRGPREPRRIFNLRKTGLEEWKRRVREGR